MQRLSPNSGIPSWRLNSVWILSSWLQSICCCSGDGTLPGAGYKQKDWNVISSLKPEPRNTRGYCLWAGDLGSKRLHEPWSTDVGNLHFRWLLWKLKLGNCWDLKLGECKKRSSVNAEAHIGKWKPGVNQCVIVPFHKPTGLPERFLVNPCCSHRWFKTSRFLSVYQGKGVHPLPLC